MFAARSQTAEVVVDMPVSSNRCSQNATTQLLEPRPAIPFGGPKKRGVAKKSASFFEASVGREQPKKDTCRCNGVDRHSSNLAGFWVALSRCHSPRCFALANDRS